MGCKVYVGGFLGILNTCKGRREVGLGIGRRLPVMYLQPVSVDSIDHSEAGIGVSESPMNCSYLGVVYDFGRDTFISLEAIP